MKGMSAPYTKNNLIERERHPLHLSPLHPLLIKSTYSGYKEQEYFIR